MQGLSHIASNLLQLEPITPKTGLALGRAQQLVSQTVPLLGTHTCMCTNNTCQKLLPKSQKPTNKLHANSRGQPAIRIKNDGLSAQP